MPTSSPPAVKLGAQHPTIEHLPPDVASLDAAVEAIELADAYGICDGHPLSESQRITLRAALGERADGSWAATRVADFGPRQGTGKNDKIAARELAGLILFGEKLIIHTAHEFPTANESFLRLVSVFENWDDLRRKVARIRYANGEQGIELLGRYGGGRLKYRARTGGSGRGFAKADLVVYDEAQHLQSEHVAASGPAKLANPNSQTWYAGSGGLSSSAVAWAIRRAALEGSGGRLAYTEMTAERISVRDGRVVSSTPDITDRDIWYATIPGLGRWVTEEGVQALLDELGAELFAREILCVWDAEPGEVGGWEVIPEALWSAAGDRDHRPAGKLAYALDVDTNADGVEWCSVAASDGVHLEIVTPPDAPSGTGWVVATVSGFDEILLDDKGPAGKLVGPLEAAGVKVRKVKPDEVVQADQQLADAVIAGSVRHIDQRVLNRAVAGVVRRDVGDGAWKFSRSKSPVDISPLRAVSLARWGALQPADAPVSFSWL